jgi:hypothetical protein
LNLTDNVTQVQVTEGTVRVRVKHLDDNETFEIDTPNLAFSALRPGVYKVSVNEAGDTTLVTVRDGQGEVTGGGQAFNVHAGEAGTFTGTDQINGDVEAIAGDDDFDHWCADRDRREDRSASARYVSTDVIGYEDLDDYGGWRPVPDYGTIWFPHTTVVGWAPYHYGHWAYVAPWGWTWVDDAPWGFAPFHYGRWVVVEGVWGWVPCPPRPVGVAYVRPVYAPALVAWVGGPHFAVGVGVGGGFAAGASVGWFPLGPREVYVPSYPVSRTYVNNVNVSNTTVNTTVVNNYYNNVVVNKNVTVTNVKYVNQGVPGAVSATSGTAFSSGRPVAQNAVKVDAREVANAPVVAMTPTATPQREAVLGAGKPTTVRPPTAIANRAVVAKTTPPPAPPSFAAQQQAIQQNGGRPLGISQVHQLQPANVQTAARANVKIAPPAKTSTPQTMQATKPGQPNTNKPYTPNNTGNPAANGNQKTYADRPPTSRPVNPPNTTTNTTPNTNSNLDAKHQQQLDTLHKQQDLERQKVEQQQVKQNQTLQQQSANTAKQQQVEQKQQQIQQKQQQQLEDLEKKHDSQQQKLQEKQVQEKAKPTKASDKDKPPKNDRPPGR